MVGYGLPSCYPLENWGEFVFESTQQVESTTRNSLQ